MPKGITVWVTIWPEVFQIVEPTPSGRISSVSTGSYFNGEEQEAQETCSPFWQHRCNSLNAKRILFIDDAGRPSLAKKNARTPAMTGELLEDMDPLTYLALTYQADKIEHGFCAFYHTHLDRVRQDVRKVLEIGVLRGASLCMWRDYFPNATIHGFDLNALAGLPDRIHVHQGDQANRDSLRRLLQATGSDFDLIVDDGGHTMEQQQVSLGVLFPHLRPGGLYAVEDLHTSFMPAINYSCGRLVHSVPTGIHECLWTTYALVRALADGQPLQSSYLSASELDSLAAAVEWVEIFDRDQDRKHITSFIRKRQAAPDLHH